MNERKTTILMVEDEDSVLAINTRMLKRRGYDIIPASTVSEAITCLSTYTPDLLILDIMLPDGNGYDICTYFRKKSTKPVLFLTGKKETHDKVEGMHCGGDYYLTKPYNFDEFIAIIERLITREEQLDKKQSTLIPLKKGDLTLNIIKAQALLKGNDVELTKKEFLILLILIQNEGKELSAQELYEAAWGAPAFKDARVIRTHISKLRVKIEADNSDDYDIVSTYGKGYTFLSF